MASKEVTILIKTFERPEKLNELIRSIREHYGGIGIIVVNDGKQAVEGDFELLTMPYDSGLSAGRNYGLSKITTPYFVLMDDDFVVTKDTHLEYLFERMKFYDLVGGKVKGHPEYYGHLEIKDDVLYYKKEAPIDIVLNFFMAKTDKVKEIGWDNDLKLAEHTDFFLRAKGKLKITQDNRCEVINNGGGSDEYIKLRERGTCFMEIFMKKHNLKKLVTFDGDVWDLKRIQEKCK